MQEEKTGIDIVPIESEYDAAEAKSPKDANDEKIIALAKLNRWAFMDLISSIDHKSSRGQVAFRLMKNCKSMNIQKGIASWHGTDWSQNMHQNQRHHY